MKEELKNYQNNRLIRSFGRIKSRRLSDNKNHLLENLLPRYQILKPLSLSKGQDEDFLNSNFQHRHPELVSGSNSLEIGFGFGDFLFGTAKNNPEIFCFGCEPHLNGVVNLLAKLEKEPLQNLKISLEDVRILLKNFPDNFFNQAYILFPDPWPKQKHFKRRLIDEKFLDEVLSPKMKNGSKLTIATDHDSYKTWILAGILRSKKFSWDAKSKKDWQNFPDDWIETKYQRKAINEGRVPVIFNLICNA